jgi:CRP/FNR family transcriptional regulator, cyclic AMP receptor protein
MASRFGTDLAVGALARSPLFRGIDREQLTRIAGGMARRRYRRNEVVFHEGDPGDSLHLLVEGRVKIVRESAEGEEAIVVVLSPGDTFGEIVLLDAAPRSATATAIEPTETLTMSRSTFVGLVDGSDAFRWHLLGGVAHVVRRLTDQLAEAHFLDLAGRLALQLTRLAEETADGRSRDIELGATLRQSDLAAMVGGTRQRVNRIMAEFSDDGLVRHEAGRIIVCDLDRMRARADW